jgi:hypothetical protein
VVQVMNVTASSQFVASHYSLCLGTCLTSSQYPFPEICLCTKNVNPQHINKADYCIPIVVIGKQTNNSQNQPYTPFYLRRGWREEKFYLYAFHLFQASPHANYSIKELGITCRTLTGLY